MGKGDWEKNAAQDTAALGVGILMSMFVRVETQLVPTCTQLSAVGIMVSRYP